MEINDTDKALNTADEFKKEKNKKQNSVSKLVSTFFRNGLKSNLDLTALADSKAGILISINGFILTVTVTASSFIVHNSLMTYAFIAIILTALGSIVFAVLAVKPRSKQELVKKKLQEGYESALFYQDAAEHSPVEYHDKIKKILKNDKRSIKDMSNHLHILAAEIKKKYRWLKYAYTYFSLGLTLSVALLIYALLDTAEQSSLFDSIEGDLSYKKGKFYNIFEPSGATTLPDGAVLLVEDEGSAKAFKLVEFDQNGKFIEIGSVYIPKKIKKKLRKVEDFEALTNDGNTIFAITSFSADRENKTKKSREKLVMLQYSDESFLSVDIYKKFKSALFEKFPELFHQNVLLKSDLNIEGLSYEKTHQILYIGFRSPLHNRKAIIIGIKNPKELFTTKDEKPDFTKPYYVSLEGQGIRGMYYDVKESGFWLIAGSDETRNGSFSLWFYSMRSHKAKKVRNIPDIGFSEGISIVYPSRDIPTLLLVEDNGKKPNKSADYILLKKEGLL